MTELRQSLIVSLWQGQDPFSEESIDDRPLDLQGWNADHPLVMKVFREFKPKLSVEIGVWKGATIANLASELRTMSLDGAVIAVDNWLGSYEHWLNPDWFSSLRMRAGYPTLYQTFKSNMEHLKLQDYVVPIPLDSKSAALLIDRKGLNPQFIHLDAGHDYTSVYSDLSMWWPLLERGGVLIGDDYQADGSGWFEVKEAFHDFFKVTHLPSLENKCLVRKAENGAVSSSTPLKWAAEKSFVTVKRRFGIQKKPKPIY